MANPYPSKALEQIRNGNKKKREFKIVNRKLNKVVLITNNSKRASRFLKAYDLYLFHVVNNHRKYRIHHKYDVYVDGKRLEAINEYLNRNAMISKDVICGFNYNGRRKLQIVDIKHNKEYNYHELVVKVDDLPNKYLFFGSANPPTFNAVIKKIKDKLQ